jgi:hypothetical protein
MLHGQRFGILLAFLWLAAAARICVEPWAGLVARYASLSSSDWRRRGGFPLQAFSMMLQAYSIQSACYTHGPISTCCGQPVMIGSDAHISCGFLSTAFGLDWIWTPPVLYFLLAPLLLGALSMCLVGIATIHFWREIVSPEHVAWTCV